MAKDAVRKLLMFPMAASALLPPHYHKPMSAHRLPSASASASVMVSATWKVGKQIKAFDYAPLFLAEPNQPGNDSSQGGDSDTNGNGIQKKYSVARAGGRRPRNSPKPKNDTTKDKGSDIFSVFQQWAVPLFLFTVILKLLFGTVFGGGANPNVVYYSSSVYQTTTYTRDGNVETTRKENFQSNIPGLVEKAKQNSQRSYGNGDKFYLDSIDEDLAELEDEIDSVLFGKW